MEDCFKDLAARLPELFKLPLRVFRAEDGTAVIALKNRILPLKQAARDALKSAPREDSLHALSRLCAGKGQSLTQVCGALPLWLYYLKLSGVTELLHSCRLSAPYRRALSSLLCFSLMHPQAAWGSCRALLTFNFYPQARKDAPKTLAYLGAHAIACELTVKKLCAAGPQPRCTLVFSSTLTSRALGAPRLMRCTAAGSPLYALSLTEEAGDGLGMPEDGAETPLICLISEPQLAGAKLRQALRTELNLALRLYPERLPAGFESELHLVLPILRCRAERRLDELYLVKAGEGRWRCEAVSFAEEPLLQHAALALELPPSARLILLLRQNRPYESVKAAGAAQWADCAVFLTLGQVPLSRLVQSVQLYADLRCFLELCLTPALRELRGAQGGDYLRGALMFYVLKERVRAAFTHELTVKYGRHAAAEKQHALLHNLTSLEVQWTGEGPVLCARRLPAKFFDMSPLSALQLTEALNAACLPGLKPEPPLLPHPCPALAVTAQDLKWLKGELGLLCFKHRELDLTAYLPLIAARAAEAGRGHLAALNARELRALMFKALLTYRCACCELYLQVKGEGMRLVQLLIIYKVSFMEEQGQLCAEVGEDMRVKAFVPELTLSCARLKLAHDLVKLLPEQAFLTLIPCTPDGSLALLKPHHAAGSWHYLKGRRQVRLKVKPLPDELPARLYALKTGAQAAAAAGEAELRRWCAEAGRAVFTLSAAA